MYNKHSGSGLDGGYSGISGHGSGSRGGGGGEELANKIRSNIEH